MSHSHLLNSLPFHFLFTYYFNSLELTALSFKPTSTHVIEYNQHVTFLIAQLLTLLVTFHALAKNQTQLYTVARYYSTTRPLMRLTSNGFLLFWKMPSWCQMNRPEHVTFLFCAKHRDGKCEVRYCPHERNETLNEVACHFQKKLLKS